MSQVFRVYREDRNPDANDDADSTLRPGGFQVGDQWVNTTNGMIITCLDNTPGAAVWNCRCRPVFPSEPPSIPVGYGAIWKDETAKKLWLKIRLDDDSLVNVEIGAWV